MENNFFQQIASLITDSTVKLVIKRATENSLIVSVLVTNDNVTDSAKNLISPLVIRGTAEEIDKGFFVAITEPVKETNTLLVNMEIYSRQMDVVRKESQVEKDKAETERKGKEERKKKFDILLKKVIELEGEKKFKEAIDLLNKATDLTEQADQIKELLISLQGKSQTSIF